MLAGSRIIAQTSAAATFQREIRAAQMSRALTNNYLLNEDAGILGYAATGRPVLLRPFTEALPKLNTSFVTLRRNLAVLEVDKLTSTANDEEIMAHRWNEAVAQPVLRDWRFLVFNALEFFCSCSGKPKGVKVVVCSDCKRISKAR
jgi:hypothetical protein